MEKQTVKIFKGDECIAEMSGEYVLAAAISENGNGLYDLQMDNGEGMRTIDCLAIWLSLGRKIRRAEKKDAREMAKLILLDDAKEIKDVD